MKISLTNELAKGISIKGFKKKSLNWRCDNEDLTFILNIQKSRFNIDEEVFTFNISVFSDAVYELCWGKKIPNMPTESDGIFRRRISSFCSTEQVDKWYVLKNISDIPDVLNDVEQCINNEILPFFKRIPNAEALYNYLKSSNYPKQDYLYLIQLSCLAFLVGDKENSLILLDTVLRGSTTWTDNAEAVKKRMNLK